MVDCITIGILLRRSMISQNTSEDGVPTGLPSKITDLMPASNGPYTMNDLPRTHPISLEQNMLSPRLAAKMVLMAC